MNNQIVDFERKKLNILHSLPEGKHPNFFLCRDIKVSMVFIYSIDLAFREFWRIYFFLYQVKIFKHSRSYGLKF
jgi:hypothetical protein